MAQRGRPRKKPTSGNIEDALEITQREIDKISPEKDLVPVESKEVSPEAPKLSKDAQDDYINARSNITSLLDKGNQLLEGITDLARESDHPRTYEVASNLIKVLIEGNRELMTLQKDIRDIEKKSIPADKDKPINIENAENVTTNVIFEGTSMEMLDIREALRERKKLEESKREE